jgi:hypothetical protein
MAGIEVGMQNAAVPGDEGTGPPTGGAGTAGAPSAAGSPPAEPGCGQSGPGQSGREQPGGPDPEVAGTATDGAPVSGAAGAEGQEVQKDRNEASDKTAGAEGQEAQKDRNEAPDKAAAAADAPRSDKADQTDKAEGDAAGKPGRNPSGVPHAARRTTVILVVALVVVVAVAAVLASVAVLTTRNPDVPPLLGTPVLRLKAPMHFAPVTGVHAAPCSEPDAVPDNIGSTCYQLDPGVTVTTLQKVQTLPEHDGTYSIRLVLSPATRQQIADLTRETVKRQLAIVVGDQVVAAPRVAQAITQDSLSIAGFTKEQATAIVALLTGPGSSPTPGGPSLPATGSTSSPVWTTPPAVTPPTVTQSPPPGLQGGDLTGQPLTGNIAPAGVRTAGTMRFPGCSQATLNGYGPYTKGVHQEYYWYDDADGDGVACDPGDLG